jgi:hypothetical protein
MADILHIADGNIGDFKQFNLKTFQDGTVSLETIFPSDARQGALSSLEVTLSATPGTVTTITLPDTAQGFRIYPRTNAVRFSINENPAAVGASSSTTIAASAFGVGGIAKRDQWEVRLLETGASRTLRLNSLVASTVVDVEVF